MLEEWITGMPARMETSRAITMGVGSQKVWISRTPAWRARRLRAMVAAAASSRQRRASEWESSAARRARVAAAARARMPARAEAKRRLKKAVVAGENQV